MVEYSADELREALRPIGSLVGKSEKACGKLAPGTWQHSMLQDNLKALRLASALMGGAACEACDLAPDDLRQALGAFASMIGRTEGALSKFSPGTSQHSLLCNRLRALRVAEALTRARLGEG